MSMRSQKEPFGERFPGEHTCSTNFYLDYIKSWLEVFATSVYKQLSLALFEIKAYYLYFPSNEPVSMRGFPNRYTTTWCM